MRARYKFNTQVAATSCDRKQVTGARSVKLSVQYEFHVKIVRESRRELHFALLAEGGQSIVDSRSTLLHREFGSDVCTLVTREKTDNYQKVIGRFTEFKEQNVSSTSLTIMFFKVSISHERIHW